MNCKYYKEINFKMFINTDREEIEMFRLCSNPTIIIKQKGGFFFPDCVYNEKNEHDCPYNKFNDRI